MLVLTRKLKQQIHIGDNITISVLAINGGKVRIGIDAPRDVRIVRQELPPRELAGDTNGNKCAVEKKSISVSRIRAKMSENSQQPADVGFDNPVVRHPVPRFDAPHSEPKFQGAGRVPSLAAMF